MILRIKRRRFGQLAIASAATTAIANLAGKTLAQASGILYGVRLPDTNPSYLAERATSVATTTPAIALTSTDLATGNIVSSPTVAPSNVSNLEEIRDFISNLEEIRDVVSNVTTLSRELITGFTVQPNGTLVNATVSNTNSGNISRLIFTNPKSSQVQNSLNVLGLSVRSTVDSLLAINDSSLLGLISINNGTLSSYALATIDATTGRVTSDANASLPGLESGRGYNTFARSPDGAIYTITVGRDDIDTLAQVNLESNSINRVVELTYNSKPLGNGLLSLAISPSGQFYGLANLNYEEINSLFTIDPRSGVLTLVRQFNADQIAFA